MSHVLRRATDTATRAEDRKANRAYPKSQFVVGWLRHCQRLRARSGRVAAVRYCISAAGYKVVTEWVMGIELPPSTTVGPGLRLRHGVGLVVNPGTVIGQNVMLRHGVTLGNRRSTTDCPTIADDVEIGVGAVVIGDITVGRGARIGPNAVVISDVPAGAVVYSPRSHVRLPDDVENRAELTPRIPDPGRQLRAGA